MYKNLNKIRFNCHNFWKRLSFFSIFEGFHRLTKKSLFFSDPDGAVEKSIDLLYFLLFVLFTR